LTGPDKNNVGQCEREKFLFVLYGMKGDVVNA
jgi:hypothetical protein